MLYRHELKTPVGRLRLFCNDDSLTGVYFEDHAPPPKNVAHAMPDAARFQSVVSQLHQYFENERDVFDVPVSFAGTEFQQQVWHALQTVAYGETRTYAQLAEQCRRPKAVRAVGAAVGRNPISIIVPCHRIVGTNGSLTGFAGGLERKRWLLNRERNSAVTMQE